MQVLLVLGSLLCCGVCADLSQVQLRDEWLSWKAEHSKSYHNTREEGSRWAVWRANYQLIMEHNKNNHSFTLGLNEFADMTQEEFAYYYLNTPRDASEFPRSGTVHKTPLEAADGGDDDDRDDDDKGKDDDKDDDNDDNDDGTNSSNGVDWRKKGCVTSVKNQGQCGSCWAFSATGAVEGLMYRKTGTLIALSEQELLDCSFKYGNAGCKGGLMDYAFKYIKSNGGICSSYDYPYKAYDNKDNCQAGNCKPVGYCSGYVDVYGENNLQSAVRYYGPVSVAIDASSYLFQFYSKGIYLDSSCSASNLNHGVLVVGYGTSDDGNYWIVKNSWGTSWGANGYVYMARGQNNMCGIASAASYPV